MLPQDADRPAPADFRCKDIFLSSYSQRVCPHLTDERGPGDHSQEDHHNACPCAKRHSDNKRNKDEGQRIPHVNKAHQHLIDPPAEVAGDKPHRRAYENAASQSNRHNLEGDAGPVNNS